MVELQWREAFPPDGLGLADLTKMMRVLAGRPSMGLRRVQPVVVFELWLTKDGVRWLVGFDRHIARHLPGDLVAQAFGLALVAVTSSPRQLPITAREVRTSSMAYPLRLDTAGSVAAGLLQLRHRLGAGESAVLQWVIGPSHRRTQKPMQFDLLESLGMTQPRKPSSGDQAAWREKISEPIFGVRGRIGAVAVDSRRGAHIIGPVVSALTLAAGPHASITSSRQSSRIAQQLLSVMGRPRTWSGTLNAAELAALLGWPIEGVRIPGSGAGATPPRKLLVSAETPEKADGDRIIGSSTHPQSKGNLVRLPAKSTSSHVHVIAPTGAGKTTTLARWILTDIKAGRSIFLVEPKGDLVADILARLPANLRSNVRLIEPGASGAAIGFNPLAGPVEDAERRADSLLQLFREIFGTAIGPRSSDVLLHTLIMAARLADGTLADIPAILTNSDFRRRVLAKVSDPLTIAPWAAGFESLSELERGRVVMPILNKTRAFTARAAIRRLIGQPSPNFNLADLYGDTQTVVLVNLNIGVIGPETTKLLGSLLLGQLRETVQRQALVPAANRRPVSVVVDEWQNFTAGMDFADMLATARGMNTAFTLAHQHLRQLTPELRAAVLANTRSRVVYRPAKADAKELASVLGGNITIDDLMQLPAYQALVQVLVDGATSDPFLVATPDLPPASEDPAAARHEITDRYGVDPLQLDAQIVQRWQGDDHNPRSNVGRRRRSS